MAWLPWSPVHFLVKTSPCLERASAIGERNCCNQLLSLKLSFGLLVCDTIWEIPQSFFSVPKHSWYVTCLLIHPVTVWLSVEKELLYKTVVVDCQYEAGTKVPIFCWVVMLEVKVSGWGCDSRVKPGTWSRLPKWSPARKTQRSRDRCLLEISYSWRFADSFIRFETFIPR